MSLSPSPSLSVFGVPMSLPCSFLYEPRMYAGLALLKLADNSENHVAIARAGGLVALLQLGRGGVVDEEYK